MKNFNLGILLQFTTMEEGKFEQKKRADVVIGIAIAAIAGFILNLLANLYYDLFIIETTVWAKVNHFQVICVSLALLGLIGFLEFFIFDYKNNFEVNKSFLKRYLNYFFYNFTPGKIIRVISGLYVSAILVGFTIIIYIFMAKSAGYYIATGVFLAAFLKIYLEEREKKKLLN